MSPRLAPYAVQEDGSRGRRHLEPPPSFRSDFQRDRDRIVHSAAFRRLEYKTQVFVNHEGDLFRTRLTHSIEVAQIARTVARSLGLNEDLCEAVSLAHDLGHTPFGHAGQDALNACMRPYGGFEHSAQSLRVVDLLEDKYADFVGLNLTFETREGILKHCSKRRARELGDVGERFLDGTQPSAEAQLANLADEIAYNNHDVDDGLRARLLTIEQLCEVPLFARHHAAVVGAYRQLTAKQLRHETVRRVINALVQDLTQTSLAAIKKAQPDEVAAVRVLRRPLIAFSAVTARENLELKQFLHEHLYRHHQVYRMTVKSQHVVRDDCSRRYLRIRACCPPDAHTLAVAAEREHGMPGTGADRRRLRRRHDRPLRARRIRAPVESAPLALSGGA